MHDLDPNHFLPLWRSVVSYFSHYRPLIQAEQRLPMPPSRMGESGSGPHRPRKEIP
jgi:hypothetical protein